MYGLVGKKLTHSFSKMIHEKLVENLTYELIETNDISSFFTNPTFKGVNITIPYKTDVSPFISKSDSISKATNVYNTVVNNNGILEGYNTDFYGLEFLLSHHSISLQDQHVLIIGNGSTMRTISYLCKMHKAKKITIVARNPKENQYNLKDINTFTDTTIIFNATPNGMYPNNHQSFDIDLSKFSSIRAVIDLIYNPYRTKLLIEAESHKIKAVNGLLMLVSQAVYAAEYFYNTSYSKEIILSLYKDVLLSTINFVLIGMPMSGKTLYSNLLSEKYNKKVIDTDQYIESYYNQTIPEIFEEKGETYFRFLENSITKDIYKQNHLAISCGGGLPLFYDNIKLLKQNGIVIFLDVPLQVLKTKNPKDRPLLKKKNHLELLFKKRYDKYKTISDIVINKSKNNIEGILSEIEVKINEYISA